MSLNNAANSNIILNVELCVTLFCVSVTALSQKLASLEITTCVQGDLSVCCHGTGGIITRSLHSHTWWSALFPQFPSNIFLWGSQWWSV